MADSGSQLISESGIPTRDRQRDLDRARESLEAWFARALPDRAGLRLASVRLPATSGVANETLLCDATWTEDGEPREGGYVVRVNSPDFLYKDVDLEIHAAMCRALRDEPGIPVPVVVGSETDPAVLGEAFFVMERLTGQVPADTPPFHTSGWVCDLSADERGALWRDAVEVLARLHRVDPARLPFLERPHLGGNGLEQDLAYWFGYGAWAARGRSQPVVEAGAGWLRAHLPAAPVTGLAWGDSRLQNLMFDDLRVVGVFDWDMVSLAGAESDLAWWTVMDYANTEAAGIARLPGVGSPSETIRRWRELTGRELPDLWFHLVYAAYRLAVVLVRLGDLYAEAGALPRDLTEELVHNNVGIQFLVQMLELPRARPVAMTWPGLAL